jgi:DtxR family Mn-dependent transcriptional regulator
MPSPTIEEYLESIYALSTEGHETIGARLAEMLGVSPPTVTATLQRMTRDGLITLDEHKEIALTPRGRQAAEVLVRRHRLSERLLVDVLGIPWHEVHDDACKLEHAISDRVEERLVDLLGDPDTCPHGNPIPGKEHPVAEKRLSEASEGEVLRIQRVAKLAESETGLLLYLDQRGLRPGVAISVLEVAPFNGPLVLRIAENTVSIGREVASLLWVSPAEAA